MEYNGVIAIIPATILVLTKNEIGRMNMDSSASRTAPETLVLERAGERGTSPRRPTSGTIPRRLGAVRRHPGRTPAPSESSGPAVYSSSIPSTSDHDGRHCR